MQPGAAGQAAGVPAQWSAEVRAEFGKLGLTANQISQVEALGLTQDEVVKAYDAIAADPTMLQQIPDQPVTAGGSSQIAGAPTAGAQQPGAAQGGAVSGGIGSGTPSGPAAWNEEWHKKFVEAGAPAELLQQLSITGAMGADAQQLEVSLGELKKTVDTELAKFRDSHPEEFKKLASAKAVDKATLLQIASGVNSGQVKDDQLKQISEQVGMTPGKMFKDMFLKQILPWTFIPGWGAIRFAASPLFGGKDPISGDPIHLDFWNHGLTGWMDAAMAVGGAVSLANTVRGVMTLSKGAQLIKAAGGEGLIGAVAAREGVANLSGMQKLKMLLPGSQSNRAVTGIARLGELQNGLKLLPEGTMAHASLSNLLQMVEKGEVSIFSKSGFGMMPFGLGSDVRGAIPVLGHRNKAMTSWMTQNGKTVLNLDGRLLAGPELAAHAASAGVNLLPAGVLAGTPIKALQTQVMAEAGTALGMAKSTNPLRNIMGIMRPGPVEDVLKAMANKPPSAVTMAFKNPLIKFGAMGLGAAGIAIFGKKLLMGGAEQPAEGDAAAQQGQAGATQLTPEQQKQFDAMTPEQQQAFLQQSMQNVDQAMQNPDMNQMVQKFQAMTPQEQQTLLQQATQEVQVASQQPNLTAQQQADLQQQTQMINILAQVAQGGQVAGGAATAQPGMQTTAPAGTQTQGASTPGVNRSAIPAGLPGSTAGA